MLKINLSGDKKKKEAAEASSEETKVNGEIPEDIEDELTDEAQPATNKKRQTVLLGVLLVIATTAAVYFNLDKIMSYFPQKAEVVETVVAPPPPPPEPEPEVVMEPDPTFVTLNKVGESVKERLWLTSVDIKFDGTYQLRGMSFSHASMNDMATLLKGLGSIEKATLPGKSKSAETIYRFTVAGTIGGVDVPEILDTIPTENLVNAAASVKGREKELGIKFTRLPKSGTNYTDNDRPFALVGSFTGLKEVIGALCPEGGNVRVFNLSIAPATPGRGFDKVQASFSLKTISSI